MKNYKIISLLAGLLVWLFATIIFRLAGHLFFQENNLNFLWILYVVVIPVGYLALNRMIKVYRLVNEESLISASIMIIPGMLLDTFVILFFDNIMPNLSKGLVGEFSSWLMWTYFIVLVIGLLKSKSI